MAENNRLKAVFAEKEKTSKRLAESIGCDPTSASQWCTDSSQLRIETILGIDKPLDEMYKNCSHSSTNCL